MTPRARSHLIRPAPGVVLSSVVLSSAPCLLLIMHCICRSRAWHWAGWPRMCTVRRSICTAPIVTGRFFTITLRTRVGVRNANASSRSRPVACRIGTSRRRYCFLCWRLVRADFPLVFRVAGVEAHRAPRTYRTGGSPRLDPGTHPTY
jgi:hypothetical protein